MVADIGQGICLADNKTKYKVLIKVTNEKLETKECESKYLA